MQAIEHRAKQERINEIELNVRTFNQDAISFYEK
jgi:ribosomal protein S18 acetylase RimI-like enzyme